MTIIIMSMYIDIITIATIFGGTSGGLVYYLTKTYFSEKIKQNIKNEYDTKLESIREDINRNLSILNSALTSQNQTFQVGQEERLLAIKTLWTNYTIIRDSLSNIKLFDDVLLEEEFNTLYTDKWKGNELVRKSLENISLDKLSELSKAVENIEIVRPFLNEQIWLNIIYLKTFCGRIIYLYNKGASEQNVKHWKKDQALIKVVSNALTDNELKFIINTKIETITVFLNFIEQKILTEIHKIVTGQVAADNTYNRALQLVELIKTTQSKAQ